LKQAASIPRPSATNDFYTMTQGTILTVLAPGVLANDNIPPNINTRVEFLSPFAPGVLTNLGDGGLRLDLTGNPSFVGSTSFGYATQSGQTSGTATWERSR
jgi:hypothetical protein